MKKLINQSWAIVLIAQVIILQSCCSTLKHLSINPSALKQKELEEKEKKSSRWK
jgi:hypothetical protein